MSNDFLKVSVSLYFRALLGLLTVALCLSNALRAEFSLSKSTEPWNVLSVYKENHLPDRSFYVSYDSLEQALQPLDPLDPYGKSKNYLSLNGEWEFKFVEGLENRVKDFEQLALDTASWNKIPVPSSWQMQGHGELEYSNLRLAFYWDDTGKLHKYFTGDLTELAADPKIPDEYNPIGYYRKRFQVPAEWRKEKVILHFAGVQGGCRYFLNGRYLGYSEDGKVPTEFDVTDFVVEGENTLAMEVMSYSTGSYFEMQDSTKTSGIQRDVLLYTRKKNHIWDFYAKTKLSEDFSQVEVELYVYLNGSSLSKSPALRARIFDAQGKLVVESAEFQASQSDYRSEDHLVEMKARLSLKNPQLWSPEQPNLYNIVVSLEEKDFISSDLGFRELSNRDKKVFLNGKPFLFKGVNRQDHDPELGKATRPHWHAKDAALMKQLNMNAVRNSHHPMDIRWYLICNRYGLMQIDEANIETHFLNKTIPGDLEHWMPPCVDRVKSMVFRARNMPSVLIWSPGNESANSYNKTLQKLEEVTRRWDPTRTFMAEFRDNKYKSTADYRSPMYGGMPRMKQAIGQDDPRPFFFCEYSHAVGNSMGSLDAMWDLIRKNDALNGGFIWDWADQSLWLPVPGKAGQRFLAHGGEYGTRTSEGPGNCDGLVTGDRRLNPECHEVKKVYENLRFTGFDPGTGQLRLENEFTQLNANAFALSYQIRRDGVVVQEGSLEPVDLQPGGKGSFQVKLPAIGKEGGEWNVRFSFQTKNALPWCESGHEVSWGQFSLPSPAAAPSPAQEAVAGTVGVVETDSEYKISTSNGQTLELNKQRGVLMNYRSKGDLIFHEGGEFSLQSALVDPTKNKEKELVEWAERIFSPEYQVRVQSLKVTQPQPSQAVIQMVSEHVLGEAPLLEHEATFTVMADGSIHARHRVVPKGGAQTDVPRIAATYRFVREKDHFAYYGLGPVASYQDRHSGVWLGIFEGRAQEVDMDMYSTLQEMENRMDNRWWEIRGKGTGMHFDFDRPLSTSYLPHTMAQMVKSKKAYALPESTENVLLINASIRGLGNKFSSPETAFKDILKEPVEFSYTMTPLR